MHFCLFNHILYLPFMYDGVNFQIAFVLMKEGVQRYVERDKKESNRSCSSSERRMENIKDARHTEKDKKVKGTALWQDPYNKYRGVK